MPMFGGNVDKLAQRGDVDGLIKALGRGKPEIRVEAVRALGELGDLRAVEPLVDAATRATTGAEEVVRDAAQAALAGFGTAAVEPLLKLLDAPEWGRRRMAARALGSIADPRAKDPLITALDDTESFVQDEAAEALLALGDSRGASVVASHLLQLLRGPTVAMWAEQARAQGRQLSVEKVLGLPGLPGLVDLLSRFGASAVSELAPALRDQNEFVVKSVEVVLRRIGGPEAGRALTAALEQAVPTAPFEGPGPNTGEAVRLAGGSAQEEFANMLALAERQRDLLQALHPVAESDARTVFARLRIDEPNRYGDHLEAFSSFRSVAVASEGAAVRTSYLHLADTSPRDDFLYVHVEDEVLPVGFLVCALQGGGFLGRYGTRNTLKDALGL